MWNASLVVSHVGCMTMCDLWDFFFKITHLAWENLTILLLEVCIIGNFIIFFWFLHLNDLFCNVHANCAKNKIKKKSKALFIWPSVLSMFTQTPSFLEVVD